MFDSPFQDCHCEWRYKKTREISIDVPAGVASGNYMTMSGEGNHGRHGSRAGDLLVLFDEINHEIFTRHGSSVLLEVRISFSEAALGTTIKVPTLEGDANLKFPAGIQSGYILRMRGKGFPELHGRGRGNQLVHIQVTTPKELSREQQDAYKKLQGQEPKIQGSERFGKFEN